MPVTKLIQDITFGGNSVNNPANYSWTDYSNYPGLDLSKVYVRFSVIAFHEGSKVNLEVTALIQLSATGQLMLGPTDLAYMPCPPFCS